MAGRATLTPEVMDTLQNVYLLNDKGNFEPAVNPLNRYSTVRKDLSMQRLGPAYGFAKEMTRKTKRPLGLVVNARGGSSINSWLKGSKDGYYEEALSRIRIAMKQGGVLKAILWHQGEADCSNPEAYKQKTDFFGERSAGRFKHAGSAGCCRTDFSMELDEERSGDCSL